MKKSPTYNDFLLENRTNKLLVYLDKNKEKSKLFFQKVKQEIDESTEMGRLIKRKAKGEHLSNEEVLFVKQQLQDILIGLGLTVAYFSMIPGATLISILLLKYAKKRGHNLFPSAFR